ncbi:ATP-binding protein [Limobrevibacterium gyesilva]|uniref:histidine kinase n=1 Tax=Limobrevibacterium gyesilva TaxID=2991712 RepID=A0AA41YJV1_9PROT|nr:ATP-binding protein [Limobrevibacterium gyesilva]MCW3475094.1 ATP-binding protein [Limobrevibacterium gyesilva]
MTALARLLARLHRRKGASSLIERLAGPRDGAPDHRPDDIVELLFEDAPFGALVVNRHGRIVRANQALHQMVGAGVDLARGAPADLVFAADRRESAWDEVSPVLAGRLTAARVFVTRLEGAVSGADARDPWEPMVSVSATALREADGEISGALLRIADITLQKQLEAQLAHSQKLQAVGQLAGGIAHDFNNLLTAVLGAAESISLRPDLDPETQEDATHIQASAARGAALVRQLLAFGRQQTLQPRVLAVNDLITDLSGLLRRLLGGNVRLELDLESPGRTVRADPTQLDQVLVNLAVNARDAMPDGGVLTLRSGHMTLYRPLARGPETIPPGRYVMIEVRDTGTGIPSDVLPRIFDPFFTTKRDRGGSGLGLSTVHGIIRQSDGFLAVESEPGQGTRVRVYLPRWDGQEAVAIPRVPKETAATTGEAQATRTQAIRRVLLVEDEEPVRRLAERTLARHGWHVLSAESGEAALALLEGEPGSVMAIVTDMVMPGMDGATLVRSVRTRLGQKRLPAILVSGYAEETLRRDLDSTATAFLPKPYSLKELAAKLEDVTAAVAAEASAGS